MGIKLNELRLQIEVFGRMLSGRVVQRRSSGGEQEMANAVMDTGARYPCYHRPVMTDELFNGKGVGVERSINTC
ncbi:hypothetical protein TNCV_1689911 [Trichonephila clavipes]|nr:hypothetical protein TNCV_1689911 [Trichonephila clavipes]